MDGAPAMAGKGKGMAVKMPCIIHHEALSAKTVQLGDVMRSSSFPFCRAEKVTYFTILMYTG